MSAVMNEKDNGVAVSMLDHALAYARAGIPVFPVTDRKTPLTPNSFKDASTDEEKIRSWWRWQPDAGIGAPTGAASGIVVLDGDIDSEMDKNGEIEIERLQKEYGDLPIGPKSETGRGGSHRLFAHPGTHVPCSTGSSTRGIARGVDVRGDGGYFVVPPSPHYKGTRYRWLVALNGDPLPAIPDWLLEKMLESGKSSASIHGQDPITESREDTLFRLGCSYRSAGKMADEILESLREENQRRCRPPLDDKEVQHAAEMAARYEPGNGDLRYTDLANAHRLVRREKDDVRYLHDIGKWFIWSGTRWAEDRDGEIERRAKAAIESLYDEAKSITDENQRKAMRPHALRSESASRIKSMLELARSELQVTATLDLFDRDGWLLNAENGTLDLRTGRVRDHQRENLITRMDPRDL